MKLSSQLKINVPVVVYIPSHHLSSRHGVLVVVRVPVAKIVHESA